MDIKFTNRLSYKQARLTVLVGFILGTLLSLLQIGIDYASEDASINREILSLLEISHNPASRIAYNIDAELAQELTLGLLRSPAIIGAQLTDNNNTVLASVKRPGVQSGYRVISDFLFGANRQFEDRLYLDHLPTESLGTLSLDVDTYSFGNRFLRRAEVTLLNGFARSLLLTGILLALFYVMLTKPLVRVIRELSSRDPRSAESTSLECPTAHENDEIGVLVQVANQQFENIATEIQQRRNAENRLTDYLGQLENIVSARTAELKAINSRLSQSNQELEVARSTALDMAEARSVFLANMSHEIRTPLNGLLGMIALSLDGPLNAEQQQQLSIAHDSGKVLVELLNDILDLSKFDAGQLELEHIPFDLGSLIEDTANLLSQNAAPSVELSCLIDPHFPALVLGDPTRVRQIVSNLLSNALKFTRFGRVDVRLSTFEDGVRIEVCDTGIGIAQDAQVKIFQPFTQAGAGITRQFGGTGLGLALTYNLCEAMQGRLTISSETGFGSQFCADLPLPSHTRALPPASLQGKVIAITAASSGLAELLNSVLPGWGLDYEQRSIDDSLLGLNPDVLITDCPECLFGLRPSCTAPILLVTAYGSFMPSEEAIALAPLQQQARPLARNALYQTLRRTLQPELNTINGARLD
ncbi:ATP-binding protein, partial [Pseudomonas sp.]|uniref:ATP-binding protein n=1 Tax=Pseudomonas sp. TaxID=306 RepID=UPI00286D4C1E